MRARRIALGLVLPFLIGLGSASGQQPNALDLLSQLGKTYASMKTLDADAEVVMGTIAPGMQQNTSLRFHLTLATPGKMRIENKGPIGMLMVFDGQAGWLYMPALNKYSKIPLNSAPLGNAPVASAVPGIGFVPDFKTIVDGIQEAKILRSETLQLDGADTDCYVIEVVHKPTQPATGAQTGQATATEQPARETVWVDKARLLIVRLSSNGIPADASSAAGAEELSVTITFDKLTLDGPVADDAFVFTPPPGATELDLSQFMPQPSTAPAAAPTAP